jgi:hypothetical protein
MPKNPVRDPITDQEMAFGNKRPNFIEFYATFFHSHG